MSNFELKEGFGSIFKNDKKGNDKAPDYSGNAMVHGKEVKIALWVKDGNKGKFFSVKVEDKQESSAPKPAEKEDDGLPF